MIQGCPTLTAFFVQVNALQPVIAAIRGEVALWHGIVNKALPTLSTCLIQF